MRKIAKHSITAVIGLTSFFGANAAMAYPDGFPHVPKHERKEVDRVMKRALGSGADISCQTIMCLEPYIGMGTDGGPACVTPKQVYFNIRVYDPWSGFDPGLTSAVRNLYLKLCPTIGPNAGIASAENSAVGELFDAP